MVNELKKNSPGCLCCETDEICGNACLVAGWSDDFSSDPFVAAARGEWGHQQSAAWDSVAEEIVAGSRVQNESNMWRCQNLSWSDTFDVTFSVDVKGVPITTVKMYLNSTGGIGGIGLYSATLDYDAQVVKAAIESSQALHGITIAQNEYKTMAMRLTATSATEFTAEWLFDGTSLQTVEGERFDKLGIFECGGIYGLVATTPAADLGYLARFDNATATDHSGDSFRL